jgi:hypothetical protein
MNPIYFLRPLQLKCILANIKILFCKLIYHIDRYSDFFYYELKSITFISCQTISVKQNIQDPVAEDSCWW